MDGIKQKVYKETATIEEKQKFDKLTHQRANLIRQQTRLIYTQLAAVKK
jgi:hypothetical protein